MDPDKVDSVVKDGLIYQVEGGQKLLCIPNISIEGRSACKIIISKVHSVLAHLGAHKTSQYLHTQVCWRDIISNKKVYCDSCRMCRQSKPNNQRPYGPLNLLEVPTQLWESINCYSTYNTMLHHLQSKRYC
jgi:hypothetical protein